MNQKYIEILNNLLEEKIGENLFIAETNKENSIISININLNNDKRTCFVIRTENGYYLLTAYHKNFKFNSLEVFTEMSKQIIDDLNQKN